MWNMREDSRPSSSLVHSLWQVVENSICHENLHRHERHITLDPTDCKLIILDANWGERNEFIISVTPRDSDQQHIFSTNEAAPSFAFRPLNIDPVVLYVRWMFPINDGVCLRKQTQHSRRTHLWVLTSKRLVIHTIKSSAMSIWILLFNSSSITAPSNTIQP